MPDTKITALTAIGANPIIPATFPIPMVDLTDTSMAASGTTKKVTVNQILGAGGTATLASATITGDLTVDTSTLKVDSTNNRVGIGTASPSYTLQVLGTSGSVADLCGSGVAGQQTLLRLRTATGNTNGLLIQGNVSNDEIFINNFYNAALVFGVNNTEQMRLNSTGLGIGASPANYGATFRTLAVNATDAGILDLMSNSVSQFRLFGNGLENRLGGITNVPMTFYTNNTERARIDASGNVGIGVTPSAWGAVCKAIEFPNGCFIYGETTGSSLLVGANVYDNGSAFVYKTSDYATYYRQNVGQHRWFIAPSGTAGNTATFTQAMTLTASGELLVGTTTSQGRLTVNDTSLSAGTCRIYKNVASSESLPALTLDKKDNTSTTSQVFLQFTINSQTAGSGQINANGASQAAFGSYSDSRLKENIVSLPSQLANILSLRPVEFDYKDGSGHQIGFVAQEMQEVYSDAVGEQNGFLTVTGWSKTEARLVSAIKELAAKVQALEAKLA